MFANAVYSFGLSAVDGGIKSQQPLSLPVQNPKPTALHKKNC